jgi:hypothetical protein
MYYGVDPHHPELFSQIEAALSAHLGQREDLHAYALIDGTFDAAFGAQLWALSKQADSGVVPLYDNTPLSELEKCAPFLARLSLEQLPGSLKRCDDKPMLSFLQSPLTINRLQRHFAAFIRVRTPSDGLCFTLRFADTVCSLDALEMFNDAQRAAFCSGFTAWHLINRQGTLTTIAGTCGDAVSYLPPAVTDNCAQDICERQYAMLVDSGDADYILCNLAETAPEITEQRQPSVLYTMVAGLLIAMDQRGIKNNAQRERLVAQALMLPDRQQALALLDMAKTEG